MKYKERRSGYEYHSPRKAYNKSRWKKSFWRDLARFRKTIASIQEKFKSMDNFATFF